MVNDCLVTKLKGVVQNDNLPKLGELKIIVHHRDSEPSNRYIGIGAPSGSAGSKARVVGDGAYFYTGHGQSEVNVGTEVNDFRQWIYGVSNPPEGQTYTIYLENKYNIVSVYDDWYNLEFDDLSFIKYLTDLYTVSLINNYKSYDINDICGNLSIQRFTFGSSLLTGNIHDLDYSETRSLNISGSRFVLDTNFLYNNFPKLNTLYVGSSNTSSIIDASRLPDTLNSLTAPTATWKTVRTGSFITMGSSNPTINFGDDVDAMFKNQANLTRAEGNTQVAYLTVRGNSNYDTDAEVQAAVETIRRKNVTVYLNGTLYPAINS